MRDDEILAHIRAAIVEELSADPAAVIPSASARTIPGWDSLAHTRVIMNAEMRLGILFDMEATYGAATIKDLVALARGHLNAKV